jgi:TM2 domain-containing membrane protein YozV
MKRVFLFFILLVGISFAKQASASSYSVDEQAVDQLFKNAVETNMMSASSNELSTVASNFGTTVMASKDKDAVVAIVLDFFLGGLGIHRFYLGTKPLTGIGYILTCGGIFGIVPLVDFIVLIIDNKDISPYIDNPKFFMWN